MIDPLQIQNPLYKALHALGACLFHALGDVCVCIQGKGRCMMAQGLLNAFNIISTLEGCDGVRMAEIVKTCIGATGLICQLLKVEIHRLRGKVMSHVVSKDKIRMLPRWPRFQLLLRLVYPLFF